MLDRAEAEMLWLRLEGNRATGTHLQTVFRPTVNTIGHWVPAHTAPVFQAHRFGATLADVRRPVHLLFDPERRCMGLGLDGAVYPSASAPASAYPLMGTIPPLYPEWLGDRSFQETHGVRFAYIGGAMARGIGSAKLVIELARCGMLGFFGAAGLPVERVAREVATIKQALDPLGLSYGANLIHSPDEPGLEDQIVDLYLAQEVRRVSASAFTNLTPSVVRYAAKGLVRDATGRIRRRNHVFAKISRPEVARPFMSPAPESLLTPLVQAGLLTTEEAELAQQVPIAEDITVESDSGGHTDNRPLNALFPTILQLRSELEARHGYLRPIRVGAAGSLGTPNSIAAAYALGAAFVLMGSVHQAAVESGLSWEGKQLLAQADLADVMMTAAGDMFEMGVKVQVLKKGTMMGIRGNQLYDLYTRYDSLDEIPAPTRQRLEQTIFRMSLEDVWEQTKAYLAHRRPEEVERAEKNPKHKMARVFKWYFGMSSRWPLEGNHDRILDYQIWCGPAMGAFNEWVKNSFLEPPEQRTIRQIALNMMEGAARITRSHQLRTYGLHLPPSNFSYTPVPLDI